MFSMVEKEIEMMRKLAEQGWLDGIVAHIYQHSIDLQDVP